MHDEVIARLFIQSAEEAAQIDVRFLIAGLERKDERWNRLSHGEHRQRRVGVNLPG
jgi:hypothetical protein